MFVKNLCGEECVISYPTLGWFKAWEEWLCELKIAMILYAKVRIPDYKVTKRKIMKGERGGLNIEQLGEIILEIEEPPNILKLASKQAGKDLEDPKIIRRLEKVFSFAEHGLRVKPRTEEDRRGWRLDFARTANANLTRCNITILAAHQYKTAIFPSKLAIDLITYKITNRIPTVAKREVLSSLMKVAIPDFSQLSFEEIMELRKDSCVKNFQDKIGEISEGIITGKTPKDFIKVSKRIPTLITQDMLSDLFELAKQVTPDIKKGISKAAITSLPIAPLNYFIEGELATHDVVKDFELKKRHGWLFFLTRIQ